MDSNHDNGPPTFLSSSRIANAVIVVSGIRVQGELQKGRYFVRVAFKGREYDTSTSKPYNSLIEWATPLKLNVEDCGLESADTISFTLISIGKDTFYQFHSGIKHHGTSLGESALRWKDVNSPGTHALAMENVTVAISFSVAVIDRVEMVGQALEDASKLSRGKKTVPDTLSEKSDVFDSRLESAQVAYNAVEPFLEKFESFVSLMDKITEIHPYVRAAWVILSAVPKLCIQELAQNKQMNELLDSLEDTYNVVIKDHDLQDIRSQHIQRLFTLIANHTQECAYFIQSFASKSHRCRLLETIVANPRKRIEDLVTTLNDLRTRLTTLLTQTAAVGALQGKEGVVNLLEGMAYVGNGLDDLNQKIDLNDMLYASGAFYNKNKCCMPNTRLSVLGQICNWIDCYEEDDDERVLLITGVAGSGKSAIAHSISHHYKQLNRLGSSFFFNARSSNPPGGDRVFSTIARDIADTFPLFKSALAKSANTRHVRQSNQPQEQFQSFIVEPSHALADSDVLSVGPIVIVIDALDECPSESKEEFMQALVDATSELPPNFRLLVTSRPEGVQDLLDLGLVRHLDLGSIGSSEAKSDITLFVRSRLSRVTRRLDDPRQKPHHHDWLYQFVRRSEMLFIWAETACKQVVSPISRTPSQVLDDILKHGGSGIDDLYLLALNRALGGGEESQEESALTHFKSLMSRIAILSMPFSINELNFLQNRAIPDDDFPTDVSFLIYRLGSVLGGATNWDEPVHFLHSTFQDFLLNPKRSGRFCIRSDGGFADAHYALAVTCVTATSFYRSNSPKSVDEGDVGSDEQHDTERYSRVLAYAGFFWAMHLHYSGRPSLDGPLTNVDLAELRNWSRDQQSYYDDVYKEDPIASTRCLPFLTMTETEMLNQLKASRPPLGYTMQVSRNDHNPFKLRSFCATITVSEADPDPSLPPWSTSVCTMFLGAAVGWENARLAFVTRRNTVLVWSPDSDEYVGVPIEAGEEDIHRLLFSFEGSYLALLTLKHDLLVGDPDTGGIIFKFPLQEGVPTFFGVYKVDLVVLAFAGVGYPSVYDTLSSTFHPNVSEVGQDRLSPEEHDELIVIVQSMVGVDTLEL